MDDTQEWEVPCLRDYAHAIPDELIEIGGAHEMTEDGPQRRFPRSVYERGHEPDARFSLANERTFLAWIRTSLALIAVGVALDALQVGLDHRLSRVTSMLFLGLGLMATVRSWVGWARTERELRENRPLTGPSLGLVLVAGLVVAVAFLGIGLAV